MFTGLALHSLPNQGKWLINQVGFEATAELQIDIGDRKGAGLGLEREVAGFPRPRKPFSLALELFP
ncbi:MAG TPA: hypothetical protein VHS96_18140 [Bacteroidia bacterium]|nr:hypothetical protein [Bacteroidia bacterium]